MNGSSLVVYIQRKSIKIPYQFAYQNMLLSILLVNTFMKDASQIGQKLIAALIQYRTPQCEFDVQLLQCAMLFGRHKQVVHQGLSEY